MYNPAREEFVALALCLRCFACMLLCERLPLSILLHAVIVFTLRLLVWVLLYTTAGSDALHRLHSAWHLASSAAGQPEHRFKFFAEGMQQYMHKLYTLCLAHQDC